MIYQKINLVEGKFGHGALKKKHDFLDRKYKRVNRGTAPIPFNWATGFDIETVLQTKLNNPSFIIPVEDQGQSDSCGGQALRYYLEVLEAINTGVFTRRSAHDPYSQIYYPGGGTTIRDIGNIAVRKGINTEARVPSYLSGLPPGEYTAPTEVFMETAVPPGVDVNLFQEYGYAFPATDQDTLAAAMRDNNGVLIELYGQNNGTWLSPFPIPPTQANGDWAHFLYAGKAKLINGKEYIGVINSWGTSVGQAGWQWLPSSYFPTYIPNALVLYNASVNPYNPTAWQAFVTWFNNFFQVFQTS